MDRYEPVSATGKSDGLDVLIVCLSPDTADFEVSLVRALIAQHPSARFSLVHPPIDDDAEAWAWVKSTPSATQAILVVSTPNAEANQPSPHVSQNSLLEYAKSTNRPCLQIQASGPDRNLGSGTLAAPPGIDRAADTQTLARVNGWLAFLAWRGFENFPPIPSPAPTAPPTATPAPAAAPPPNAASRGVLSGLAKSVFDFLRPKRHSPQPPVRPQRADDTTNWVGGAPTPEPVWLGCSAPQRVQRGDTFTARFVAYVAALEDKVREELKDLSPAAKPHLGRKSCQWLPGTRVKVAVGAHRLQVTPAALEFTWSGARDLLEFDVMVPDDAPSGLTVLRFDAMVDDIVVATLRLDLEIEAVRTDAQAAPATNTSATAMAAQTAFASYSSDDRARVLDRLAAIRISAGLDVYMDCLSLHPGQEWEPQLEYQIKHRDLFLLFWSQAAAKSKWVDWEWRTAMRERGKHAMQIHPLEVGVKPPVELKDLHFGDPYMLARKATEAEK